MRRPVREVNWGSQEKMKQGNVDGGRDGDDDDDDDDNEEG